MQFNSYLFLLLFLPAVLAGYFGLCRMKRYTWARGFLAAMSLVFFAYGNPWYLGLLVGSAVFNWAVSRMLVRDGSRGTDTGHGGADSGPGRGQGRKLLLISGIFANLALLFYFKYMNFFIENLNAFLGKDIAFTRLLLPVGISFFTFQQIAWLVESFRKETEGYGVWDYFLCTVYFPKIAMGPILLHGEFIPQLREPRRRKADSGHLAEGLMILAVGLFKKVILAEFFAGPVNWGFAQVEILSSTDAFLVMTAYTFQLYFDFSGYCDMAMGISRMFNLELPLNFNSPYKALSPVEFWKRWHMTLTRFLRKYIYFPMGGSRKGPMRTCINIMVVFLVSGFWHGAAWTFILWGVLHGAAQALNRMLKQQWENLHTAFQWMATFLFVNLTWVIFRSESIAQAKLFFKRLLDFGNMQINPSFMDSFKMAELPLWLTEHRVFTVLGLYGAVFCLVMNARNMGETELRPTLLRGAGTAVLLVWSVLSLAGISSFIYFQF